MAGDNLGCQVALQGNTAVIGALKGDGVAPDAGTAYVFTRNGPTWTEQATLTASNGATNDHFSRFLALSGDTLLVGADQNAASPTGAGTAYVFTRTGTTWTPTATLTASDGLFGDQFGFAGALDGTTVLIGAPYHDTTQGTDAGAVYVFTAVTPTSEGTANTFIAYLYTTLYGRSASPAEIQALAELLTNGTLTVPQLIERFFQPDEYADVVEPMARLYFAAFDRLPDPEGLAYWINVYRMYFNYDGSVAIAQTFADSPEFQQRFGAALSSRDYINQLYLNVLKRPADQGGLDYWTNRLNEGVSQGEMLLEFSESTENRHYAQDVTRILLLYSSFWGRNPTPEEIAIAQNRTLTEVITTLLTAPSYVGPEVPNMSNCGDSSIRDLTVTENTTITTNCLVGHLTIKGNAILLVDFTSPEANTFIVKGNVLLQDTAQLIIRGNQDLMNDGFIIANDYNSHRTLTTTGNSILTIDHIILRTQTGTAAENGSVYMSYNAQDNSTLMVNKAALDTESSWLLGNFQDRSVLQATHTRYVPTEIYLNDACSVTITGSETKTGLWMALTSGLHTINLPNVNNDDWSWNVHSNIGTGVNWSLSVHQANPGLGMSLYPNASAIINGHGTPQTGELKIGYFVSTADETIENLKVGLQNGVIIPGRLTLNHVHLGPIAWQIYSTTDATLTVNHSTINEIGLVSNGRITVNNSTLQLAVLACYGQNGILEINHSEVWNQSIEADNNCQVILKDTHVYGSLFITKQALSKVTIRGGAFYANPPMDPHRTMVDMVTGDPNYNPFRSPGDPRKQGIGIITCMDVLNCDW